MGRPIGTIEEMQRIAESRGGECLSKIYIDKKTKLQFRCAKKHVWETTADNIKNAGTWCPECAGKKKGSIEEMQQFAKSKGGKCISETYINTNTKLKFECENGHHFEALPQWIRKGEWCGKCSLEQIDAQRKELFLEEMRSIAKHHGGECLSTEYTNSTTRLTFKCTNGHIFDATLVSIKHNGAWCNRCHYLLTEEKCRYVFEKIFQKPFNKTKRILGNKLELDGYNDELKLAFEYQGMQHYHFIEHYFKSKESFEHRLKLDQIKVDRCKELGIHLVVIPYWENENEEKLISFILSKLGKTNHSIQKQQIADFFNEFKRENSELKKLQEIAKEKGGECLSNVYLGNKTKLTFRCASNHVWKTQPATITAGRWCPKCGWNMVTSAKRLGIEKMREVAISKGGECLSTEYINNHTKLKFRCSKKHEWETTPHNIMEGNWCPQCYAENRSAKQSTRLTIERMREIAEERGGKCLSNIYINQRTKLQWECAFGHIWEAQPSNVISRGSWCPECKREKLKKRAQHNLKQQ